jgi:hypothetical protein
MNGLNGYELEFGLGLGSTGSDLTSMAGVRPAAWLDQSGRLARPRWADS